MPARLAHHFESLGTINSVPTYQPANIVWRTFSIGDRPIGA